MRHAGRDVCGRADPGRTTRRRPRDHRQGVGPHRLHGLRRTADPHRHAAPADRRARAWLDETEFEDAIAATNLLPGPASTQLAIFCAWRLRGGRARWSGVRASSAPGWPSSSRWPPCSWPPTRPRGSRAPRSVPARRWRRSRSTPPLGLIPASWRRAGPSRARRVRWVVYGLLGGVAAATVGTFLVLVLLGCGVVEVAVSGGVPPVRASARGSSSRRWPSWRRAGWAR